MSATIHSLFFSPTHSGEKIAQTLARGLGLALGKNSQDWNLTLPAGRTALPSCGQDDVLLLTFPVYGGRVPRLLEAPLARLDGKGALAVVVAVYGNRDYDDALLEAADMLTERGFCVVAAAAFIAEHSLAPLVGAGRPDVADMASLADFARRAAEKILECKDTPVAVKGARPYKALAPAPAVAVAPVTADSCTDCLLCVEACPMNVISRENPRKVAAGCLRCQACVKICPEGAKSFTDERVAQIKAMLESKCMARREPELFL